MSLSSIGLLVSFAGFIFNSVSLVSSGLGSLVGLLSLIPAVSLVEEGHDGIKSGLSEGFVSSDVSIVLGPKRVPVGPVEKRFLELDLALILGNDCSSKSSDGNEGSHV